MSQITVRGLGPVIEQKIRQLARDRRQSINYVLTEIIRRTLDEGKRTSPAATLKHLAGGWSEQEASDFLNSIGSCEQIDEEMWR
jgi:fructose-bisphosphate aldolase class 1